MKTNTSFIKYINEIKSYKFESVKYTRTHFSEIETDDYYLRIKGVNYFDGRYENLLLNLSNDAFNEIIFWNLEELNSINFLIEEELDNIKRYMEFNKIYMAKIIKHLDKNLEFEIKQSDKHDFMFKLTNEFNLPFKQNKNKILKKNEEEDFDFKYDYGKITESLFEDIGDAITLKENSLISFHNRMFTFYQELYEDKKDIKLNSLNSGLEDNELIEICRALKDKKILSNDVKEENFVLAFTEKEIPESFIPLKWTSVVSSAIFLKVLFNTDDRRQKIWNIASKLFENGTPNSLKTAYNKDIEKHQILFKTIEEIYREHIYK